MTTRNRTVNYIELDSDDDDEVIYVGQCSKAKPKPQGVIPTITLPNIILGEEEYLVEIPVFKEQLIVAAEVVVENRSRAIFQTLPYEVCSSFTLHLILNKPIPSHQFLFDMKLLHLRQFMLKSVDRG